MNRQLLCLAMMIAVVIHGARAGADELCLSELPLSYNPCEPNPYCPGNLEKLAPLIGSGWPDGRLKDAALSSIEEVVAAEADDDERFCSKVHECLAGIERIRYLLQNDWFDNDRGETVARKELALAEDYLMSNDFRMCLVHTFVQFDCDE